MDDIEGEDVWYKNEEIEFALNKLLDPDASGDFHYFRSEEDVYA